MRAGTAVDPSARAARGELTLMGIGPGTATGVPIWGMERTPSDPIVLEPRASRTSAVAATVQIPIPGERVPSPTMQIPIEETAPVQEAPRRIDSLFSGRFFLEGDFQEANGWEDSPLALEPTPEEEAVPVTSFDHIARRRGPLVATMFVGGAALLIFFGMQIMKTGAAHTWLTTPTGQRVAEVWSRARMGLAVPLTAGSVAASARAMTEPASRADPIAAPVAIAVPEQQVTAPVQTIVAKDELAAAPVAAPTKEVAVAVATRPRSPSVARRRVANEQPARGVVWSPSEQRVVAVPAAGADEQPTSNSDKAVLPLDEDDHGTLATP